MPLDLKQTILSKLGATAKTSKLKRQQDKADSKKQALIASQKEGDLLALGGSEKLTLEQVFKSLDVAQQESTSGLNANKLRSQLKSLNKQREGAVQLEGPLAGRKRVRLEQEANYKINQKKMAKYLVQVKHAREQVQADFTSADKISYGGGVQLKSTKQLAANFSKPQTPLEMQIYEEQKRQGLNTEQDLVSRELKGLEGAVDPKQLAQRYDEMARLKTLLFRQEIKHRRVAKIKSKLYHKLKKKDKEREEEKLRQYLHEVDPEAAKAYQAKVELKQVEERLRMRHGTGTKYAKNLKRFRNMDD